MQPVTFWEYWSNQHARWVHTHVTLYHCREDDPSSADPLTAEWADRIWRKTWGWAGVSLSERFCQPFPIEDSEYRGEKIVEGVSGTALLIGELMPREREVRPVEPYFQRCAERLIKRDLQADELAVRPDIDVNRAVRHIEMIAGSFRPLLNTKTAAIAWLMSLWFNKPSNVFNSAEMPQAV